MEEQSERSNIAELTTEIVAAYVSFHKLRVLDVSGVINAVGTELAALGTGTASLALDKPEPAVSVRRSVRPDHLVCLICARKQKLLKRHLAVEHGLTPNQYRETFGLKSDYPMVAPNYAEQRRALAVKIGLGRPKKSARGVRKSPGRPKTVKRSRSAKIPPPPSTGANPRLSLLGRATIFRRTRRPPGRARGRLEWSGRSALIEN